MDAPIKFSARDFLTRECVGCGYCCIKSPCLVSQRLHGKGIVRCPELVWDAAHTRYVCKLMTLPGELGLRYRTELYAGAGCCCSLNSWRHTVSRRDIDDHDMQHPHLDPLFQKFLLSIGGNIMTTSDAIALVLHGFQQRLINDGMEADEVLTLVRRVKHILNENRSSFEKGFMG
jgi:hypothetical protein